MPDITFNPPPGWPAAPAGSLPPESWKPDPSWPAPPAGWVFYRDAVGNPAPPPAGSWMPIADAATVATVLTEPPAPFTPPTPPPTLTEPAAPPTPAAAAWTPAQPAGTPQFATAPQFGATAPTSPFGDTAPPSPFGATATAPQQPPYGQYQPGTPYGGQPEEKKSQMGLIIGISAVVVAAAAFLVYGLIQGFPWESDETPSVAPPTMTTSDPTEPTEPPTTPTPTSNVSVINGISMEQFDKLVTENLPAASGALLNSVSTQPTLGSFFGCGSMAPLLQNLVAVSTYGEWNNDGIDIYLFDTPESAHAMGVALGTCWNGGAYVVDESVVERNGATNYSYTATSGAQSQIDNLVVVGNVAAWPDTLKTPPFEEDMLLWEEQFAFGAFPAAVGQVQ